MTADPGAWDAVTASEESLRRGEPLAAFNHAQAGLAARPADPRLRQLQALALARSGDLERANALLETLAVEGHADAETLGMLARTHKELGLLSPAGDRARHLTRAFDLYRRGADNAEASGDLEGARYAGINAATLALIRGEREQARALAARVRAWCGREAAGDVRDGHYWREATLGEAALLLGEPDVAATHYGRAALAGRGRHGDLASTRHQALLLAEYLPPGPQRVADLLHVPPVLVFTGHMVDAPGRAVPRFPASLEPQVAARVGERLAAIAPLAVYGSAACGADLLCLEAAHAAGAETHVVLPFPPEAFREASVAFAGPQWAERFDRALARATSVTVTSDHSAKGSAATFEYANLVLTGAATLRARALGTPLVALAVSDDEALPRPGGAAWLAARWRMSGLEVDRIALAELRGTLPSAAEAATIESPRAKDMRHEMRAMLFADAVGYSKLTEDQIPGYIEGFLGAVAALARRTRHPFEHVETAGDGLYMVFTGVEDAGRFALELNATANAFDRAAWNLPPTFNLRIALHCGPVHCARDPIGERPLYTGPHTSRAARIEPVTPPGQVYASGAFAADAAASGCSFRMSYVGRMPLAKSAGALELYHLRSAAGEATAPGVE